MTTLPCIVTKGEWGMGDLFASTHTHILSRKISAPITVPKFIGFIAKTSGLNLKLLTDG